MTMSELADKTTIVVGASRGLGRGIATAFSAGGCPGDRRCAPPTTTPDCPFGTISALWAPRRAGRRDAPGFVASQK